MSGQPTRFYGLALGKEGNFKSTTDGLITAADTTPDVSTKSLFWAENPTAISISTFDNGKEGQVITVVSLDTGTTLTNGTIVLKGASDYVMCANDAVTLINHNASWYEIARSQNVNAAQSISTPSGPAIDIAGGAKIVSILGTSGNLVAVLTALSGGVLNQDVFLRSGSGNKVVVVKTGGNILLVGTNAVTLNSANLLHLIKTSDFWRGVITY